MHTKITYRLFILACILLTTGCAGSSSRTTEHEPTHAIHNLHQLADGLWSGSEPLGTPAYNELAKLGIQTVVSVDAVAPDKALADQYNIRVVHLPIGYDGIPEQRTKQLAVAVATLPRPIYLHCHHGKHRGPAAICVGAIGAGEITNEQAADFMALAGTSPDYPGLWRSAEFAEALDDQILADKSINLPEQADIGDFPSAMAEIDRLNELLWLCADNNFVAPEDHPDLAPVSLVGQIHYLLRSLESDSLTQSEGVIFQEMLLDSSVLASQIESQITTGAIENAMTTMNTLTDSCVRCHEQFRD